MRGTATIEKSERVDKTLVEKRVRDWKKRISDLYSDVKDWTKNSDYSLKLGAKLTMYEKIMAQSGISPTQVDTADIYKENKIVLTIKPKGLWIIGVNGRIDILSSKGSYILIDMAEEFKEPKWRLINGNKRGVEFNKQSFFHLLSS